MEKLSKWKAEKSWLRSTTLDAPVPNLRRRGRTVSKRLVVWYRLQGRTLPWRRDNTPIFQQVVCEVLLQQTTATAVASEYHKFFFRFPNWEALADAAVGDLEEFLKPLGLWRRRARVLHALGLAMKKRGSTLPSNRSELEMLPGVGQYIASAVLVFAHGEVEPLIDVNMARVIERYFGVRTRADIRHDAFVQQAARACIASQDPVVANWAFLDLGGLVCRAKTPRCHVCPLRRGCYYARVLGR